MKEEEQKSLYSFLGVIIGERKKENPKPTSHFPKNSKRKKQRIYAKKADGDDGAAEVNKYTTKIRTHISSSLDLLFLSQKKARRRVSYYVLVVYCSRSFV
ncbi:hypothetical protein L2E82_35475 [Cichorium intybus]|uniref:Uncharacterized protein n=1 Tax=Cichorium intybus TaxID=13427 RepID=A0ACB9BNV8_CICIN|nr:hypothetical protein L2E82_35475 [Cichorium intybus]